MERACVRKPWSVMVDDAIVGGVGKEGGEETTVQLKLPSQVCQVGHSTDLYLAPE